MVPGRREWDTQVVKPVLYPHDAQEVLKIRLSERAPDDHVAGIFSVRSAYRLAVNLDTPESEWSAKVPPKARGFARRALQHSRVREGLGVRGQIGYCI
jgi:hypothetical protein